jgi:hypothetical protein
MLAYAVRDVKSRSVAEVRGVLRKKMELIDLATFVIPSEYGQAANSSSACTHSLCSRAISCCE